MNESCIIEAGFFKDGRLMQVISRYLGKEIVYTMLAITGIVIFIFICNQFVRYLDYVATGKYAINMLFRLTLYQIPVLFPLLLPLGLFLGILLGYGRMYADSEMTVLFACGYTRQQLLKTTLLYTMIVAIVVGIFIMWINPIVAQQRDRLMDMAESSAIFQTIMPGHFESAQKGKRVFYVQKMSHDRHHLYNVFVAQQLSRQLKNDTVHAGDWVILSARKGQEKIDKKTGGHFMVAKEGYRYEGVPGQNEFQIVKFSSYGVRIHPPMFSGRNEGEEVLSMAQLVQGASKNSHDMAELQWRISLPISVFILGLLAVPLSHVNPRHGRFVQLIPAVIIYIVYANMLFVSRDWLESGVIPAWIGLWWVHLLVLSLAFWLLSKNPLTKSKAAFYLKWFVN